MDTPLLLDKPLGATPLQALTLLRTAQNIPESKKLAYAGRLDPMASGLLAVVHGEQLKHQEEYWYLPKQYAAEVVLGVSTDSYDLMGIPTRMVMREYPSERITSVIRALVGKIDLSVPIFSSHRYQGAPLFALAKSQPETPVIVPVRRMMVSQIDVQRIERVSTSDLSRLACERVALVQGDFRQEEILQSWKSLFLAEEELVVVRLDIHCGGGTYIRSLAHEIGRRLGSGATLMSLRRTRIGKWRLSDPTVLRGLSWPQ